MHDFVLIDCPAGIEQGFKNAIAGADEAVVVATPEVSSIRDADRVVGLLAAQDIPTRLIVNRISPHLVKKGDMLSQADVIEILALELLGAVPLDEHVVASTNKGMPAVLDGKSIAAREFIADRASGSPASTSKPCARPAAGSSHGSVARSGCRRPARRKEPRMWNMFRGKPSSREVAKGRLHLVLAHDRVGLEGGKLQEMRREIAAVISKYVPIDVDAVEVQIETQEPRDRAPRVEPAARARRQLSVDRVRRSASARVWIAAAKPWKPRCARPASGDAAADPRRSHLVPGDLAPRRRDGVPRRARARATIRGFT